MWCVIKSCKNSQRSKLPDVSFHRFPKDEPSLKMWAKNLNIDPESLGQGSVVCSDHFNQNDYKDNKGKGVRRSLYGYAVPFIHKEIMNNVQQDVQTDIVHPSHSSEEIPKINNTNQDVEADMVRLSHSTEEIPKFIIFKKKVNKFEKTIMERKLQMLSIKEEMLTARNESYSSNVRRLKRKMKDLNNHVKSHKKIKVLKRKLRRKPRKNIRAGVKEILNDLKNKTVISDESTEILDELCGFTINLFDLQMRKVVSGAPTTIYDPKIKDFARNLNLISPQAYVYVRETFNNCLPGPGTIRRWDQDQM